ncbi:MAG: hypothetical protein ACRD2A_25865 [Vicinamibacterales bacterium]
MTRNVGIAALEAPDGGDVYYTQTPVEASALWRQSTSGGEPVKVLAGVVMLAAFGSELRLGKPPSLGCINPPSTVTAT